MREQASSLSTIIVVIIVAVFIAGSGALLLSSRPDPVQITINPPVPTSTPLPTSTPEPILVYITGAVNQPETTIELPHVEPDQIIVFNGSQSVLDTIGKVLITPDDKVALESPSYLGAISAFNAYEPAYVSIDTDDNGVIPESLDEVLTENEVKFIYLVTTFQNPTGRTLSIERRKAVADVIKRHNALVVEDDPYSALRYRGEPMPPLYTFAPDNVIHGFELDNDNGNGLGLNNMHKRARFYGGAVDVDSILGEGTTIDITIPIRSY